ncbi:MAG: M24 family metallopeptidase [Alphaproteobacteria bacterium]
MLQAQLLAEDLTKTHSYASQQDIDAAIVAAKFAHQLTDEILTLVRPGVRESEIKTEAEKVFAARGIDRIWHQPYIRFGSNSLLTFQNKAKTDRILEAEDIAFIDIGVVKGGVEGDAGRTIAFGENKTLHDLAKASETIFKETAAYWKQHNPTGAALYEYTHRIAEKLGVIFNLDPAGHLIGAFPHRGWKRGLNHFPEQIIGGTWILEIQIRHPELPLGAFYEDLLY